MRVAWLLGAVIALAACRSERQAPRAKAEPVEVKASEPPPPDPYRDVRERMVDRDIAPRGVADPRVLEAMRSVKRHEFVAPALRKYAYDDRPLPIEPDSSISQPYIVAVMTEAARLRPGDRVLEIGTGSGYQAAVLAELGNKVFTIDIVETLVDRARAHLERLGYDEVKLRVGNGHRGWPEAAPFDAIIVTTAPTSVPEPLIEQLEIGGRMVIPVGHVEQYLQVITRDPDGYSTRTLFPVRFGPMLSEAPRGMNAP